VPATPLCRRVHTPPGRRRARTRRHEPAVACAARSSCRDASALTQCSAALACAVASAAKLGEQFPTLEDSGVLDELIPKKDKLVIAKWCAAARDSLAVSAAKPMRAPRSPPLAAQTT